MQTVEIDKQVLEDMFSSMRYLHGMVQKMFKLLHHNQTMGRWLTPYAAANALRVTPRVLLSFKESGRIGYFQEPGGNALYKEAEVLDFLNNNRQCAYE